EVVRPRIFSELRRLVDDQPFEAFDGLPPVLFVSGELVQPQIAGGHVTAPLGRRERLDTQQRAQIDGTLAADLLQQPIEERADASQTPERRRETVERLVRFVAVLFDPTFNLLQTLIERPADWVEL